MKAVITRANGDRVEAEGTAAECAELVRSLDHAPLKRVPAEPWSPIEWPMAEPAPLRWPYGIITTDRTTPVHSGPLTYYVANSPALSSGRYQ